MEIEIVTFVTTGSVKLTVPRDRQKHIQVRSKSVFHRSVFKLYLPCPITLIAFIYQRVYIRLPRRDQGIVYLFVGQGNRHWREFA